jgi:inorganic pyrophosphatase
MSLDNVSAGSVVPDEINVIVEIPMNSEPVKYEVDKASGAIFVDRVLTTSMRYPYNYGYVPRTLCGDGDPIDVIVIMPIPLVPCTVIACTPIGLMAMRDENGEDTKIIAIPVPRVCQSNLARDSVFALPEDVRGRIQHFFEHYKDLEKGKWVKLDGWRDADMAKAEILASVDSYNAKSLKQA